MNKTVTYIFIGAFILGIAVIITFVAIYLTRSKSVLINPEKKNAVYNLKVGDEFYTTASDKPSVGTINLDPIVSDDSVVKYLGKEVEDKSKTSLKPGMTGGDLYVNTYKFQVVGIGTSNIEIPTEFRGEEAESAVYFTITGE
jgi:hypothetical protein